MQRVNLLDFNLEGLKQHMQALSEKPFRALQLFKWIHQRGVDQFEQMTDISKTLRDQLQTTCTIQGPEIATEKQANDGTVKWLMKLQDNNHIETVFIPEVRRGTLCISSQVGCILNCAFCSTGKQGFSRNLAVFEIIGQLWQANRRLRVLHEAKVLQEGQERCPVPVISNVVMMGMGEPLLNFDAVIAALSIMRDDHAYGLSKRRVTLSTAGIVPEIDRLSVLADVSLAVSLHAPTNALRNELVPLNKKYPLTELMEACKRYVKGRPGRHITMEYVLLKGVNDTPQHAKALSSLLEGTSSKINLIPFNPFEGSGYMRSTPMAIEQFRNILTKAGWVTTVRKTRGDDIDAACGQLVGRVLDRTHRQSRFLAKRLSHNSIPVQVQVA